MWNGIRPNGLAFLLGKVIPRFNVHVSMRERRLKTAWNAKILLKRHRIFHPCLVNYCMPLGREPWYLDDPRCAFYFVQKSLKTSQHVPAIFTKVGKLVWTCPKLNARTWVLDSFGLGSEVLSLVLISSNRTRISPAPKTQETDSIEGFVSTSSGSSVSISSQWSPNILRHRKTKKSSDGKKINPKSIPNSQKQKQLPNTQWVKYVYCTALLTVEVGRARRNHGTNTLWKTVFSKSVCNTVEAEGPIFPKLVRRVFLKELLSTSLFTSST